MAQSKKKAVTDPDQTMKSRTRTSHEARPPAQSLGIAATLRKISEGQQAAAAPSNATVRAALERLAKQTTPQSSGIAATLRKISEGQQAAASPPSAALKAALEGAEERISDEDDLTGAVKRWAKIYGQEPKAEGCPHVGGFRGLSGAFQEGADARRIGWEDGLSLSAGLSLNPWLRPGELIKGSASGALQCDWARTEQDLWRAIERVSRQLDALPEPTQERLRSALIRHLKPAGDS